MCSHQFKNKLAETPDYNVFQCYTCQSLFLVSKIGFGFIEDRTIVLSYLNKVMSGEIQCV